MREEIRFFDIAALVCEKDKISNDQHRKKWKIVDYEALGNFGKLLWANENSSPDPVTLRLGVEGRYHIFVGTIKLQLAYKERETITGFKLLSEQSKPQIRTMRPPNCWKPTEWIEESYYTTADMTNEGFVLFKPALEGICSALAWIRLVPAEIELAQKEPCMAYHFDMDYLDFDSYSHPSEILGGLRMLKDGAPKVILHEKYPVCDISAVDVTDPRGNRGERFYVERSESIDRAVVDAAHEIGSKIYASYRMQAGGFVFPDNRMNYLFCDPWFESHLEYRCVTRDGRVIETLSFAYPEVRARVIKMIVDGARKFDGVCLFYHRGTFVAFEEPVKRMVYEKYGIDATRAPMSDPRLHSVLCHFMTLFMSELREALDAAYVERKDVNAILFHNPTDSMYFGYDAAEWIKEGIVDSISQGLMTHFEELEGLLDDEGLIDLEKYEKALYEKAIVKRNYAPDLTRVTEGAKAFLEICDGKADFYGTLAWEGSEVDDAIRLTDGLKSLGVKSFISWNTDHKARILPILNAEKFYTAGTSEIYEKYVTRFYRVLSLGGADVSHYNPSWKG